MIFSQQSHFYNKLKLLGKCLLSIGLLLLSVELNAETKALDIKEYTLKAAFLVNFVSYITWRDKPQQEDVQLCILGENPFVGVLEKLIEQANQSSRKQIQLHYKNRMQDLPSCHMVYLSNSEKYRQTIVIDYLIPHPVVTVSSLEGFAQDGGGIEFIMQQQRVRFYINNTALNAKNIQISASLLSIAVEVY